MKMQKRSRGMILGVAVVFMAFWAHADDVTISTFYPSPYGSYKNLDTTGDTKLAAEEGKVEIGKSDPGEIRDVDPPVLHVNGNVHINGILTAAWVNTTHTFPTASPSDLRFKTDLKLLTDVLPKLDQLHGFSYQKSKLAIALGQPSTDHRELGVVGQELEKVFPELVVRSGPEEYRSVDYGRLSVVLLEAVKELRMETNALKRSNAALQRRLMTPSRST